MTSLMNHGLSSLVINRARHNTYNQAEAGPIMTATAPILISSDDEVEHIRTTTRPRAGQELTLQAGPIHVRSQQDLGGPSLALRDSKRQKTLGGSVALSRQASLFNQPEPSSNPKYPCVELDFHHDKAYPDFFAQAFIPEAHAESPGETGEVLQPLPSKLRLPPYFHDAKLNIRLFRGKGCEHFPVPVDLDQRYVRICNDWDKKEERKRKQQTRYNQFGPYVDYSVEVYDSESEKDASGNTPISTLEQQCLDRILEVIPDVDSEFLLDKIRGHHESWQFGEEEMEVLPDTGVIVSEIFEMVTYPKQKPAVDAEPNDAFEDETGKTIEWRKDHCSHPNYQTDAIILLTGQFEHVPTQYLSKVMTEKKSLWNAYIHIDHTDTNWFQMKKKPYSRSKHPRVLLENKNPDQLYYVGLVTELQAAKQYVARQSLRVKQEQLQVNAEKLNLEQHKAEGRIITCLCCFEDEVPLNRAIQCVASPSEHSFCFGCTENLAKHQVGLMRHEMMCMDGGGCKEKLDLDAVGRAIPIKLFDRLLFNEQQNEIAAANIEGLEQCPFCDFKAICDPVEEDSIFSCQSPDCFKVSCRYCHETSHLPRTCEEVKKERSLDARHKVEEARSEAMMRSCPSCKAKILKESGCNKLKCQCGTVICYNCRLDLSKHRNGYDHFNKTSKGCPLYDVPGVDRHVQETEDAERKAIADAKAEDETIDEKVLQIETGKIKIDVVRPVPIIPAIPDLYNARQPMPAREHARAAFRLRGRRGRGQDRGAPVLDPNPQIFNPFPPPAPFNFPTFPAFVAEYNNLANAPAPGINSTNPVTGLGVRRAELLQQHQQQQQIIQLNAIQALQPNNPFGNMHGIHDPGFDLALHAPQNQQVQDLSFISTANRVHDLRAEHDRRRRARRNRAHNIINANVPLQYPHPNIFNVRNLPHQAPNLAENAQPGARVDIRQLQQPPQTVPNSANTGQNGTLAFGQGLQIANTLRDQNRPPTPLSAANNNNTMGRGRPYRRQTLPNNTWENGQAGTAQNTVFADWQATQLQDSRVAAPQDPLDLQFPDWY